MERPIRIVLADDHPVVRIGVKNMLVEKDGFEVVGEAADGDEAITSTLELQPDILLLDVQMPRLPGLEAMRAIMNGTATVKILLLTSTITTQQIIEALHIGARGIVLKDALANHLPDDFIRHEMPLAHEFQCSGHYWRRCFVALAAGRAEDVARRKMAGAKLPGEERCLRALAHTRRSKQDDAPRGGLRREHGPASGERSIQPRRTIVFLHVHVYSPILPDRVCPQWRDGLWNDCSRPGEVRL